MCADAEQTAVRAGRRCEGRDSHCTGRVVTWQRKRCTPVSVTSAGAFCRRSVGELLSHPFQYRLLTSYCVQSPASHPLYKCGSSLPDQYEGTLVGGDPENRANAASGAGVVVCTLMRCKPGVPDVGGHPGVFVEEAAFHCFLSGE